MSNQQLLSMVDLIEKVSSFCFWMGAKHPATEFKCACRTDGEEVVFVIAYLRDSKPREFNVHFMPEDLLDRRIVEEALCMMAKAIETNHAKAATAA